jgi:hypothetical protein
MNCLAENCTNEVKGRRYCCPDCKSWQKNRRKNGPPIEEVMPRYEEVDVTPDMLNDGAWMVYPKSHTEKQCVGDFIRVWKRAPKHFVHVPQYPLWNFCGPVHNSEELARRWMGGTDEEK